MPPRDLWHIGLPLNISDKSKKVAQKLAYVRKKLYLCSKFDAKEVFMTALQLNAEITDDPTRMTKEEFFARLDEAEKGPRHRMLPGETLDEMLTRLGYV